MRGTPLAAVVLITALLCNGGCVHARYPDIAPVETDSVALPPEQTVYWERIWELESAILQLSPGVDPDEASQVAQTAVFHAMSLANEYGLVFRPLLQNIMINVGLRKRGLCVHWTEDMLAKLETLDAKTLEFEWGVANRNSDWPLEHSSPVVSAVGRPFEEGIVLDGWRDSGWLYWAKVTEDEAYVWELFDRPIRLARSGTVPLSN